jgi:large subunit ribosomal protein L17
MRHRKNTFKLGRRSAHLKALLANQVSSLILCGQIETTLQKAKGTRKVVEKMVTYAKKGDLHHRRLAIAKIRDENAVKLLFSDIAPRFSDRKGGYTKILKLGKRLGDNAEMTLLKWADSASTPKTKEKKDVAKKKVVEKKDPKKKKTLDPKSE